MNMKLMLRALFTFVAGALLLGAMIFLPAGTLAFPGGWVFMGALFIPMLLLGAVLLLRAPDLLEKRLNRHEKEKTQKGVIGISALMFIAVFVLSGLDFRFGWSRMPLGVCIGAAIVQLISYGLYAEVMRENAYLSRTIEVQEGQKVVDTGMYAIVRHPMYAVTVVLFLAMPLTLGSWAAFAVMLIYPALIVVRILNEEKVLREGLEGYTDYCKKVRWRILPYVW